jgi:alpha-galactosidase
MIMWHPEESVEVAALQVLNILFSVPQISVRLAEISPEHRRMLDFWLGYWTENKAVLLDGDFRAVGPVLNYPMVTGQKAGKRIAAVYQDMVVPSGAESLQAIDIVNGKPTEGVVLRMEQSFGRSVITVYDTLGREVSEEIKRLGRGTHAIEVPPAGLVQVRKLRR